jgi:hypothetical protein
LCTLPGTGGTSGLLLSLIYLLHDAWEVQAFDSLAQPCVWLGMNSIVVYAGDEIGQQMLVRRGSDPTLKTALHAGSVAVNCLFLAACYCGLCFRCGTFLE